MVTATCERAPSVQAAIPSLPRAHGRGWPPCASGAGRTPAHPLRDDLGELDARRQFDQVEAGIGDVEHGQVGDDTADHRASGERKIAGGQAVSLRRTWSRDPSAR